jgi:hypothetical protein
MDPSSMSAERHGLTLELFELPLTATDPVTAKVLQLARTNATPATPHAWWDAVWNAARTVTGKPCEYLERVPIPLRDVLEDAYNASIRAWACNDLVDASTLRLSEEIAHLEERSRRHPLSPEDQIGLHLAREERADRYAADTYLGPWQPHARPRGHAAVKREDD